MFQILHTIWDEVMSFIFSLGLHNYCAWNNRGYCIERSFLDKTCTEMWKLGTDKTDLPIMVPSCAQGGSVWTWGSICLLRGRSNPGTDFLERVHDPDLSVLKRLLDNALSRRPWIFGHPWSDQAVGTGDHRAFLPIEIVFPLPPHHPPSWGKEIVSKLNPNLFSPILEQRWHILETKRSHIEWCSDIRLYYTDQSIHLIFQCDKYIIMISLVYSCKKF